jgi:hypothetical protein
MAEEQRGFQKRAVRLPDGRELIYYSFVTPYPPSHGADKGSGSGDDDSAKETGRV